MSELTAPRAIHLSVPVPAAMSMSRSELALGRPSSGEPQAGDPLRVGPPPVEVSPVIVPPLWQLVVARLDEGRFDYTPEYLGQLLNLTPGGVRKYCRRLFPRAIRGSKYLLELSQACVLIYHACRDNRTIKASSLFIELLREGQIDTRFPQGYSVVQRATSAIHDDRELRKKQRAALCMDVGLAAA